jgi:predicted ArsR family transcriptional regulator
MSPQKSRPAKRSGIVTGARIVLTLQEAPQCPAELAVRLSIEASHVRRACRVLHSAGVLQVRSVHSVGTPAKRVYSITPTRPG